MYCPLVLERVWVRGCTHEFVVVHANYSACVATISPVELREQEWERPFRDLFAQADLEASKPAPSLKDDLADALRASRVCIRDSETAVREMRYAAKLTHSMITKSQELISQTDAVIERWRLLGCKP